MAYPEGFKSRLVARMIGPDAISVTRLAEESGVGDSTLWRWRKEALEGGYFLRESGVERDDFASKVCAVRPEDLPAEEKLRLLKEAEKLDESELGEFLRRHGLHESQVDQWRQAALGALVRPRKASRSGSSPEAKRIRELEKELGRKDRALAEVTALLALKKKLDLILGDEDESTTRRSDD